MNQDLEFCHLVLAKKELETLSARDQKRLLMVTNMLRDMDLFRKLLIYTKEQNFTDSVFSEAAFVSISLPFIKLFISKCFEVRQFFLEEKVAEDKRMFSKELLEWWNNIEVFFNEQKNCKLFSFVRNKFGFHFDHYQEIESYIKTAMNEVGDMKLWTQTDQAGNDLYASSNTIMLVVLRNKMQELGFTGNEENIIGQLQRLPIEISHSINEFCKLYLLEIILKGKCFSKERTIIVTAPLLSDVSLPLIVSNDLKRSN